jgi:hypothetical protein
LKCNALNSSEIFNCFQMMKEIETTKMFQLLETYKSNLLCGLKEKDRSLCNLKLEHSLDELKDFKAWFDFLTLNTNVSESFNFCKLFCVFLF